MAEIRIEGKPVFGTGDHLYLVFADDSGAEFVIRGGPQPGTLAGDPITVEVGVPMGDSEENGSADYRPIEDREARGSRIIGLEGRDASEVWNIMLQQAQQIAAHQYNYNLTSQNSNSTVSSVLHAVGINVETILPD